MGTDMAEVNSIWEQRGWPEKWKRNNESPRHRVRLDGFWMYRAEVTDEQFARFVQETGYRTEGERTGHGWGPYDAKTGRFEKWEGVDWRHPWGPDSSIEGKDSYPVRQITWDGAVAYCLWAGAELPTEAQWEYAARGGNTGLDGRAHHFFVWGDDPPQGDRRYGNFRHESLKEMFPEQPGLEAYDDSGISIAPVASFEPNGFGLYDMAGNVAEWCRDCYDPDFYAECHRQGVVHNPVCSSAGSGRAMRSMSCGRPAFQVRPARRYGIDRSFRSSFRCVRPGAAEGDVMEARAALKGAKKDVTTAQQLLLNAVRADTAAIRPEARFYAYVYLGYIADRDGRREEAASWYTEALEIEDVEPRLRDLLSDTRAAARQGVQGPITWIRHLDEGTPDLDGLEVESILRQASAALQGRGKDAAKARRLLSEITENGMGAISAHDLCCVYVYLGYMADRRGLREEAISSYEKAAEITDAGAIAEVAKEGLERPVTWIKELDKGAAPPPYVLWPWDGHDPICRLPETLSREERIHNFEVLAQAIDQTYAHFEVKHIDWAEVVSRYRPRVEAEQTVEEFHELLSDLVCELRDGHSYVFPYPHLTYRQGPWLAVERFGEGAYVTWVPEGSEAERKGVETGSEIVEIDGMTVRERLEQRRPHGRSSEHEFRCSHTKSILSGRENTAARVKLVTPEGRITEVTLARDNSAATRAPRTYPFEVSTSAWGAHGRHPTGLGYIHLTRASGARNWLDMALAELRDTPGLIFDLRGNPGGFGSFSGYVVGRFLTERTRVSVWFRKHGPGRGDLHRIEAYLAPGGKWQYRQPLALLINNGTFSGAEDTSCFLRSAGRVTAIGSSTAGQAGVWSGIALLPCGIPVRISMSYACDGDGVPIEGTGNPPDIQVEPTIQDFLAGRDPVIEKAVEVLQKAIAE